MNPSPICNAIISRVARAPLGLGGTRGATNHVQPHTSECREKANGAEEFASHAVFRLSDFRAYVRRAPQAKRLSYYRCISNMLGLPLLNLHRGALPRSGDCVFILCPTKARRSMDIGALDVDGGTGLNALGGLVARPCALALAPRNEIRVMRRTYLQ